MRADIGLFLCMCSHVSMDALDSRWQAYLDKGKVKWVLPLEVLQTLEETTAGWDGARVRFLRIGAGL